tara:strand:+ start:2363 stop:3367 length:1005 start_codon:yes stop_codon:yes gene_type:complete
VATIKNQDLNKKSPENQELIEFLKKSGEYWKTHRRDDVVPNLEDFERHHGEVVAGGKKNAAVILIDDNPKYADDGGHFCSRISLVAGILGSELNENISIEKVEPRFDAAGIYITQRGSPQEPLGLTSPIGAGKHNKADAENARKNIGRGLAYQAHSDVTACADTIQLVAKTGGVNIYGGLPGAKMSTGQQATSFVGVNLIAGNRIDEYDVGRTLNDLDQDYKVPVYSLQPLVKGHSLQRYLSRLTRDAGDQASENFSKEMKLLITEITDCLALFAGFFSAGAGAVKAGTLVLKVPLTVASLAKSVEKMTNTVLTEVNSTEIFSDSYLSRWNKTN